MARVRPAANSSQCAVIRNRAASQDFRLWGSAGASRSPTREPVSTPPSSGSCRGHGAGASQVRGEGPPLQPHTRPSPHLPRALQGHGAASLSMAARCPPGPAPPTVFPPPRSGSQPGRAPTAAARHAPAKAWRSGDRPVQADLTVLWSPSRASSLPTPTRGPRGQGRPTGSCICPRCPWPERARVGIFREKKSSAQHSHVCVSLYSYRAPLHPSLGPTAPSSSVQRRRLGGDPQSHSQGGQRPGCSLVLLCCLVGPLESETHTWAALLGLNCLWGAETTRARCPGPTSGFPRTEQLPGSREARGRQKEHRLFVRRQL